MSDLTLYTHPMSRGRIIRWMMEEIGEPYQVEIKDFEGNIKAPDYLAINPMGKVPALKHGDTVVTEVAAICAYLADAFPEKGLAPPPGSPERGPYYRWLFFMAGPFEMASTAKSRHWPIDPGSAQSVGCGMIEDSVDVLEQAVANASPYLCGKQFTAADLLVASYLGWGMMQGLIEERPAFRKFVDIIESRPAARRADDLDNALIKEPA